MIYEMHGAILCADSTLVINRRFVSHEKFFARIEELPKFVSIDDALLGQGNAMTIDDGTFAAFNTAKKLREYGHQVTLYINGLNSDQQVPYFFLRLSAALDLALRSGTLTMMRRDFGDFTSTEDLRARVKSKLLSVRRVDHCERIVDEICFAILGGTYVALPPEAQTIGRSQILELVERGVTLGNHGWEHISYSGLTSAEINHQFSKNREWIEGLGCSFCSSLVAPFGAISNIEGSEQLGATYLDASRNAPAGWISSNHYNRRSLDYDFDLDRI